MKEENKISKNLLKKLKSFSTIIDDIDTLILFYEDSSKMIFNNINEIKKKYKIGLYIADKLDEIITDVSDDIIFEKKLKDLYDFEISNGRKIFDIIDIFADKNENNHTYSIRYSFKSNVIEKEKALFDPVKSKKILKSYSSELKILYTAVLESIIQLFEDFLKSCYTLLSMINPNKYFGDKNIKVSEIFKENPIVDFISAEIENAMYDSLKCLDIVITKENLNLIRVENFRPCFEEIYFRRNIAVHNSYIVNEQYMAGIKGQKSNVKIGDKLIPDDSYINKSIICLFKMVVSLEYEIALCIKSPKMIKEIDKFGFRKLKEQKYDIAEYVFKLLKTNKSISYAERLDYIINYLNAKKHLGNNIKEELEKLDMTAAAECYKIAKYCLEGDNSVVLNSLRNSYPDSFSATEIREWPIFIDFRKSEEFLIFKKEHKKDFSEFDYELENTKNDSPNNLSEETNLGR